MKNNVDIAIIGASFAGLACAREAAMLGRKVTVIERKAAVSDRIHTTGIFVAEALEEYALPEHLLRPIHRVRLYAPSLRYTDFSHDDYRFYATDTAGVLNYMAEQAVTAGAELILGQKFDGYEEKDTGYALKGLPLETCFLIGADGARSAVARSAGLSCNAALLKGAEYEYDHIGGVGDALHVFIDPVLAPGYIGWVFRGVHQFQVGLACKAPVAPDMDAFLNKISPLFDFKMSRLMGRRGGWIPAGGTLKHTAVGNVLLAGDAAGLVSPLTAGGIRPSLHYGKLLARHIDRHMHGEAAAPSLELPKCYPKFRVKRIMRWLFELPIPAWIYEMVILISALRPLMAPVFYTPRWWRKRPI